jgi:uncharacterized protein YmfQ (DUF2313 family)
MSSVRPYGDPESYHDLLMSLLPPGEVWCRQKDTALGRVLGALANAMLMPIAERAADLLNETVPHNVLELLKRWEDWLDLPDVCDPASGGDLVSRRAAILMRETAGPINRLADLRAFIEGFGYGVDFDEPMPLGTGRSRTGCARVGGNWHGLLVKVLCRPGSANPRIGTGRAGLMRVGDCIARPLDCLLRRFVPAHIALAVYYV